MEPQYSCFDREEALKNFNVIIRYAPPHKYDMAPYGTYCKVMKEPDEIDLYLQESKDEEHPRWEFVESYKKV